MLDTLGYICELRRPFEIPMAMSMARLLPDPRFFFQVPPFSHLPLPLVRMIRIFFRFSLLRFDLRERTTPALPIVLQRMRIHDLVAAHPFHERHVHRIQIYVSAPIRVQILHQPDRVPGRAGDERRVVFARVEGVGEGDGAVAAGGGFHGAADGAAGEGEEGGGVAAVVGTGDDEVDGREVSEEVVET